METRRYRDDISISAKKLVTERILCWVKLSFKSENRIKIFPDNKSFRSSLLLISALQVMAKGVPLVEIKGPKTVNQSHKENPNISVKVNGMVNTQAIIKAAIIITKMCNSTFAFYKEMTAFLKTIISLKLILL